MDFLFASLKNKNYKKFITSQAFSQTGGFIQNIAISLISASILKKSSLISIVLFFNYFPIFIFSYPFGILSDKFSKKKIILFGEFSLLALCFGLIVFFFLDILNFWMFCVLGFLWGTIRALQNPCVISFSKDFSKEATLKNAVSINLLVTCFARASGPLICLLVFNFLSPVIALIINFLSYFPSIFLLLRLDDKKENKQNKKEKLDKKTKFLFLITFLVSFFATNYNILFISLSKKMGSYNIYFPILMGLLGFGAFVGFFILNKIGKNYSFKTVGVLMMTISILYLLISLLPKKISFALVIVLGICDIMIFTMLLWCIQKDAKSQNIGRLSGIYTLMTYGSMPIGTLILGFALRKFSINIMFLIISIGVFLTSILFFVNKKRDLK